MAKVAQILNGFNAGEWSPEMAARTDIDKYPYALHLSENFILKTEGAAVRRGGFRYVNTVKGSNRAWLKRFEYRGQTYILEFGDQYIRFFTNHGALLEASKTVTNATAANPVVLTCNAHGYTNGQYVYLSGFPKMRQLNGKFFRVAGAAANTFSLQDQDGNAINGTTYTADTTGTVARVYEISSPYDINAVTELTLENEEGACGLKTWQVGDVMYITCNANEPNVTTGYKPRKLTRVSDTSWTLSEYDPPNGPFLEVNTGNTAVWASGTEGSVTIRSTSSLFTSSSVGRLIKLTALQAAIVSWATSVAKTAGDYVRFGNNTYRAVNSATTGANPPTHTNGIVSDGAVLWEYQHSGYGIAKITAYTSATQVTATVQLTQPSEPGVIARLPADLVGTAFTISNITQANPGVVTAVGHTFVNGDAVAIDGVVGMTEVNGRYFVATGVAGNNFSLLGVDTTGYTAYGSVGQAVKGATFNWQLGAWSSETGYPTAVSACFSRIMWLRENRIWGTVSNDFENMAEDNFGTVTSENAINVLAPEMINGRWMVPGDRLLIGAQNGEFLLREQTPNEPIGPNNIALAKQGRRKCADIEAVDTGEYAIFVQQSGRKLYAAAYNFDADKVKSYNTTAFSAHVTKPYLIDSKYQDEPTPIVWNVRGDGEMPAMTFDPDQSVTGWHRHIAATDGVIESIEISNSPDQTYEEVWAIINKTIDGVERRYVCYMERPHEEGDEIEDAFYVDLGVTYDAYQPTSTLGVYASADAGTTGNFTVSGSLRFIPSDVGKRIIAYQGTDRGVAEITSYTNETTVVVSVIESFPSGYLSFAGFYLCAQTITGLEHLEGLTVHVNRDGGENDDCLVTDGAITLDDFAMKAQIGVACDARLVTMRLDQGSQNGTAQGKIGRVHELVVRLAHTVGGKTGPLNGRLDEIPFRTVSMAMDTAIPAFTGDKRVPFPGDSGRDDNWLTANTRIEYRADKPFPATIVGLIPHYVKSD